MGDGLMWRYACHHPQSHRGGLRQQKLANGSQGQFKFHGTRSIDLSWRPAARAQLARGVRHQRAAGVRTNFDAKNSGSELLEHFYIASSAKRST